VILIYCFVLRS